MRRLMTILEYAYREESGSSFTHDGAEYDLNCVLAAVANIPAQAIAVSELAWILDEESFHDEGRVLATNLDAPLLITRWNTRWVVLDGWHRLVKAVRTRVPVLRAHVVPESFLRACSIR